MNLRISIGECSDVRARYSERGEKEKRGEEEEIKY
jgi:hypothetical protein